jgi:hypothetical protein
LNHILLTEQRSDLFRQGYGMLNAIILSGKLRLFVRDGVLCAGGVRPTRRENSGEEEHRDFDATPEVHAYCSLKLNLPAFQERLPAVLLMTPQFE